MTIAQQLKVKEFPFVIKDNRDNAIYWEHSEGYWERFEYDSTGRQLYCENSNGYWSKRGYDSNGNESYFESSDGFWVKNEFDSNGNSIYCETSGGHIIDKRPKQTTEVTLEDIASKFNIPLSQLKIKK